MLFSTCVFFFYNSTLNWDYSASELRSWSVNLSRSADFTSFPSCFLFAWNFKDPLGGKTDESRERLLKLQKLEFKISSVSFTSACSCQTENWGIDSNFRFLTWDMLRQNRSGRSGQNKSLYMFEVFQMTQTETTCLRHPERWRCPHWVGTSSPMDTCPLFTWCHVHNFKSFTFIWFQDLKH